MPIRSSLIFQIFYLDVNKAKPPQLALALLPSTSVVIDLLCHHAALIGLGKSQTIIFLNFRKIEPADRPQKYYPAGWHTRVMSGYCSRRMEKLLS